VKDGKLSTGVNVALTPVLSLPSFTGNRNNIDIFLYN